MRVFPAVPPLQSPPPPRADYRCGDKRSVEHGSQALVSTMPSIYTRSRAGSVWSTWLFMWVVLSGVQTPCCNINILFFRGGAPLNDLTRGQAKQKNRGVNEIWTDAVLRASANASKGMAPKALSGNLVRMADLGNVPRQEKKFKVRNKKCTVRRMRYRACSRTSTARVAKAVPGILSTTQIRWWCAVPRKTVVPCCVYFVP